MPDPERTKRYLICCRDVGAIIDMPVGRPSEYWTLVQNKFEQTYAKDPKWDWTGMHSLDEHSVAEGVYYHWELAGPGGASFLLFQLPDITKEQLDRAKTKLRRERDVVRMRVLRIKRLVEFKLP